MCSWPGFCGGTLSRPLWCLIIHSKFFFLQGGSVLSSEGQVLNELKYVLSCGIFSALDLTRRTIMERDFCDKR